MGSALGQLARRRRRRTHAVARKRLRHDVEQHYGVAVVDDDLPVHTYASQRLLVRVDGIERSLTAAVAARWEPVRLFERGFDELPPAAARQPAAATPRRVRPQRTVVNWLLGRPAGNDV